MSQPIRLELPPGCTGIDGPGRAKVYEPKERGGAVVIDDAPGYARQLAAAGLHVLPSKAIGFSDAPEYPTKTCSCGRLNFAWAETCPACGTDFISGGIEQ
jgi:hypothetical protein